MADQSKSNDSSAPDATAEKIDHSKLADVPQPPEHFFGLLGNIPDIDPSFPVRSLWHLMDLYGPIFKFRIGPVTTYMVGTQEIANEVFDQERFIKVPNTTLQEIRALTGDGLFTAFITEKNWCVQRWQKGSLGSQTLVWVLHTMLALHPAWFL